MSAQGEMAAAPRRKARIWADLRRAWFTVHQWLGVGLMVFFVLLGVSGSVLVWPVQVEKMLHPARFAVSAEAPSLRPSQYVEAGRLGLPRGDLVSGVRFPGDSGRGVTVAGAAYAPGMLELGPPRRAQAFVDPAQPRVIATTDGQPDLLWAMHALHGYLFLHGPGRQIVGWLGWAMFLSCLTGIWLWWPRKGSVLKGFRWTRSGASINGNLHHQVGIWIVVPLAVVVFSGVYVSFPKSFAAIVDPANREAGARGGGGPPPLTPPLAQPRQDIDHVAGRALQAVPGELVSIVYPTAANPRWAVTLAAGGEERRVAVDDATGLAKAAPASTPPRAARYLDAMMLVHFGEGAGIVWQVVLFLTGVASLVLGITGTVMWASAQLRKARQRNPGR